MSGEGVEHPPAMAAAVVQDRGAAAVDGHAVALMAARAGEPVGVQPTDELGVTGVLVHQVGDREVHGRLQAGAVPIKCPEYRAAKPGRKLPSHHLAHMSQPFLRPMLRSRHGQKGVNHATGGRRSGARGALATGAGAMEA